MSSAHQQRAREFIGALRDDEELLKALAVAGRSPALAAIPMAETYRYFRGLITVVFRAYAEKRPLSESDLALAAQLGNDRAEHGIPIEDLLTGMRSNIDATTTTLTALLRTEGIDSDTMLDGILEMHALMRELEDQATRAHRAAEIRMSHTARDQRNQLLRQLLHGIGDIDPEHLHSAGLDLDSRLHCLVTDEHDARKAQRLELRLAATGRYFGLVDGMLCGVTGRLPSTAELDDTLMIVGPAVTIPELSSAYRLCRDARDTGRQLGLRGVVHLEELAADLALDIAQQAEPGLHQLLSGTLLTALTPADAFHRELAATALAYLDHGNRIDVAAAALHVHPNTVKYRLRRLRELTARDLDPPAGSGAVQHTLRWWWALRRFEEQLR